MSSNQIFNKLVSLGNANVTPKANISKAQGAKPFSNFMEVQKTTNIQDTDKIASNKSDDLPSLGNIAKQINSFKFNMDEVNNIY